MPYKPTGNPPGRPRKLVAELPVPPVVEVPTEPAKPLSRAREGFRRAFANPADNLHRPPRTKKREVGRRPILHPNVIA
jgi:hypothetical protein